MRAKSAAAAALSLILISVSGCSFPGMTPETAQPAQEASQQAGTGSTAPAEEEDDGVIASGELELTEQEELYTEEYTENLSPDGTPVLEGSPDISECITLCSLDGLEVRVTLEPEPDRDDAIIAAKMGKNASPAGKKEIEKGDIAYIDMTAETDGENNDLLSREDVQVCVGAGGTNPELESALIGMSEGEDKTVDITYPDDYEYLGLNGKTVTYSIHVNSVASAETPSEEEIEKQLTRLREINTLVNEERRMQAIKLAVQNASEIRAYPEKLVRQARARYEKIFKTEYQSIEDYLNDTGRTREEFKKDEDVYTSARVKDELTLIALQEETGITKTSSEFNDYVAVYGVNPDDTDETLFKAIFAANMDRFSFVEEY